MLLFFSSDVVKRSNPKAKTSSCQGAPGLPGRDGTCCTLLLIIPICPFTLPLIHTLLQWLPFVAFRERWSRRHIARWVKLNLKIIKCRWATKFLFQYCIIINSICYQAHAASRVYPDLRDRLDLPGNRHLPEVWSTRDGEGSIARELRKLSSYILVRAYQWPAWDFTEHRALRAWEFIPSLQFPEWRQSEISLRILAIE